MPEHSRGIRPRSRRFSEPPPTHPRTPAHPPTTPTPKPTRTPTPTHPHSPTPTHIHTQTHRRTHSTRVSSPPQAHDTGRLLPSNRFGGSSHSCCCCANLRLLVRLHCFLDPSCTSCIGMSWWNVWGLGLRQLEALRVVLVLDGDHVGMRVPRVFKHRLSVSPRPRSAELNPGSEARTCSWQGPRRRPWPPTSWCRAVPGTCGSGP